MKAETRRTFKQTTNHPTALPRSTPIVLEPLLHVRRDDELRLLKVT